MDSRRVWHPRSVIENSLQSATETAMGMLRIDQVISARANSDHEPSSLLHTRVPMERPTALISVWDKTGIEELAASLQSMGWAILSTGGTATRLRDSGIEVMDVSEATGPRDIRWQGQDPTPAVHGGILASAIRNRIWKNWWKWDMGQLTWYA